MRMQTYGMDVEQELYDLLLQEIANEHMEREASKKLAVSTDVLPR